MTVHRREASFLDLHLLLNKIDPCQGTVDYRVFRNSGNPMLYLQPSSFHAPHVFRGFILTELIRYLLRSSRACYYTEEATILHNAFVNRGYLSETFFQVLRKVDWTARDSFTLLQALRTRAEKQRSSLRRHYFHYEHRPTDRRGD